MTGMFESARAERCDQRNSKWGWDYRRKQRVVLLGKKAKEAGEEKQLLFFPRRG
jgi:hypothetical protein